jgi:hypothetical protein
MALQSPAGHDAATAAIDLGDGRTTFRFQGRDFLIDLDAAFEKFGEFSKVFEQYDRTGQIQQWIKETCDVDLNRSAANRFEFEVVKLYLAIKKKRERELAGVAGLPPSTDSGPDTLPGSSDSV